LFHLFLTRYAIARPRHSFQSFEIDLISTREAPAKTPIADTPKRFFHHTEQLLFLGALPEQKILRICAGCAVDNVSRYGIIDGASGVLFLGYTTTQFLPAGLQLVSELLQPLLVHGTGQGCDYSAEIVSGLPGRLAAWH
jgi:hypothetical protein